MMICPCITATNPEEFATQLGRVSDFAKRLHIDVSDGEFSPVKLINPANITWPSNVVADIHVMYRKPLSILETLIALQPQTIIIPIESDDVDAVLDELTGMGIKRGVAVLQDTPIEALRPFIERVDHVLIFSGDLGHFGGQADTSLLSKVAAVKQWRADVEIGWDGGINEDNITELQAGGVDVFDVGGTIQRAENPLGVYKALEALLNA